MSQIENMTEERFAQLHPTIQEKILAGRAAAERRNQKKEDREAVKTWLRFEELRAIPIKARTPAEKNEFQRLWRQQKRRRDNGEQTVVERVDDRVRTKEQFWQLQRASLTAKIPAWREREQIVLDTLAWFDRLDAGKETLEECGENYLSAEEGLQDVLGDIEEHGTTRLGSVYSDTDIQYDWSDGHFTGRAFFRDAEVFRMLQQENEPTRVYATTGILIALPDWMVVDFLKRHCGYSDVDAQHTVGRKYRGITLTYGE